MDSERLTKNEPSQDFPGDPGVKNPPSTPGDAGLIPGQGTNIQHTTGWLSLHASTKTQCSQINIYKKYKPLSVEFEFRQWVSIGKVRLLWNDCIVLYFMYLRVVTKTSYKYHKYMVCKKSMSRIWFYGKKILVFLCYSDWGKLSSYQCYIPFYPAEKLRILGATDKRSTIKERMQLLNKQKLKH